MYIKSCKLLGRQAQVVTFGWFFLNTIEDNLWKEKKSGPLDSKAKVEIITWHELRKGSYIEKMDISRQDKSDFTKVVLDIPEE